MHLHHITRTGYAPAPFQSFPIARVVNVLRDHCLTSCCHSCRLASCLTGARASMTTNSAEIRNPIALAVGPRIDRRQVARGPLGLPLECDLHFAPPLTVSAYTERARKHRRIVT
jgi:hypothetical protein